MQTTKCARCYKPTAYYKRHVCTGGTYCKGDCKSNGMLVDSKGNIVKETNNGSMRSLRQ